MQGYEIENILMQEMKTRWVKWNPTDTQLKDWRYVLSSKDFNIAVKTIQEMRIKSKSVTVPLLVEFNMFYKDLAEEIKKPASEIKSRSFYLAWLVVTRFENVGISSMYIGRRFELALSPAKNYEKDGMLDIDLAQKVMNSYADDLRKRCGNAKNNIFMPADIEFEIYIGDENWPMVLKRSIELKEAN